MRTIKFRGKDIKTGEWLYVDLRNKESVRAAFIATLHCCNVKINPITIGQFTGLTDKNGNEIYEGDIVKTKQFGKIHKEVNYAGYDIFEIQYINAQFMFFNEQRQFYLHRNTLCEIIGNIHDNPELINGNYKEEEL